jgi:hypothetical protein
LFILYKSFCISRKLKFYHKKLPFIIFCTFRKLVKFANFNYKQRQFRTILNLPDKTTFSVFNRFCTWHHNLCTRKQVLALKFKFSDVWKIWKLEGVIAQRTFNNFKINSKPFKNHLSTLISVLWWCNCLWKYRSLLKSEFCKKSEPRIISSRT